jgi:hypothetical protein
VDTVVLDLAVHPAWRETLLAHPREVLRVAEGRVSSVHGSGDLPGSRYGRVRAYVRLGVECALAQKPQCALKVAADAGTLRMPPAAAGRQPWTASLTITLRPKAAPPTAVAETSFARQGAHHIDVVSFHFDRTMVPPPGTSPPAELLEVEVLLVHSVWRCLM